jgi:phosphatidylglycerol lysyltransferase
VSDSAAARARALELVRAHGHGATSFQILELGLRYHFDGDGCVGYADTGGAWVAAGDPVAAPERQAAVADSFCAAARRAGRRPCFFATTAAALAEPRFSRLHIGEQPLWDPRNWDAVVAARRSLRYQLSRARHKQVTVRLVAGDELAAGQPLRAAVEQLIHRWRATKTMAPMGFMVDLQPFAQPAERRYIIAEHDGRLVGFLAAVPIYPRRGWFLEDLLRDPAAPNGTAELIIDHAMRVLAAEGAELVTLGLAPLAGEVPPWLRRVREVARPLYDFGGLYHFKAKLRPDRWEAIYLATPAERSPLVALYDALVAFARGAPLRFGLATLLRGPGLVLWAMALMLLPWTAMLAATDATRWYPAPWVKWAWVAFDGGLLVALVILAARYRHRYAIALAAIVTLDAVATLVETLWFNARQHGPPIEWLAMAAACLAPALGAAVLWGTVRRRVALRRPPATVSAPSPGEQAVAQPAGQA